MMNFTNVPADIPAPVKAEIERIHKIKQDNYGVVFAVRDIYETVLKFRTMLLNRNVLFWERE